MYNLDSFHIDEYMMIVMIEQLEPKFGVYFENCEENIVTPQNMPWLDIGDLPSSYSKFKRECFQQYVVPIDKLKDTADDESSKKEQQPDDPEVQQQQEDADDDER